MNSFNNIVTPEDSIKHTLKVIDNSGQLIAFVCNKNFKLLGTVTDGDVRRGILENSNLDRPVSEIMNSSPITLSENESDEVALALMKKLFVRRIPIVDNNQKIVGLKILEKLITEKTLVNSAVIMAGGLGSRLRPLSNQTPKPMLKVATRPILEIIIDQLKQAGIDNIFIALNYLGEQINDHFGDGKDFGVNITYINETEPKGTAGALSLIPEKLTEPFIVMNGDILTKIDFKHMIDFHNQGGYEVTVGVSEYVARVPYGVIELNNRQEILEVTEKPENRYLINAGIYVINPDVINQIPEAGRYDMTELMTKLLKQNARLGSFPIREYWLDVGQHDDFERAQFDFNQTNNEN